MTLENQEITALVCSVCNEVICPYCFMENGEMIGDHRCQGHIGNLTDECDHGEDDDDDEE